MLLKTFEYSIFHVLERRTSTVAGGDNEPSAASIFEQIRAGQQFVRKAETEEGCKQLDEEMKDEPGANPVLAEATEEVTEGKLMASCRQETRIPKVKRKTLAQIMEKHENLDAALSDLWKLLFFLRSGAEGCDVALVPHPFATRLATQKKEQRWHDKLLQQIKQMDEQLKQPAVRQSRQTAWMTHTEQQRKKHAPALPASLDIDRADIICGKINQKWEPCQVVSVWRNFQARSGNAQLVARSLPRGSLSAVRAVRAWDLFTHVFCSMFVVSNRTSRSQKYQKNHLAREFVVAKCLMFHKIDVPDVS